MNFNQPLRNPSLPASQQAPPPTWNTSIPTPAPKAKKTAETPSHSWEPLWGTSQVLALFMPADSTLYTGTRGPGKTDTQLMAFKQYVGLGYGQFWRGIILDVEYKNLDDLVSKSKRWFPASNDGARFLESKGDYKWIWPTGEELLFRTFEKESDYDKYHGHEYPFEGWNELCKQRSNVGYESMQSCNRSSFTPEKDSPVADASSIDPVKLKRFYDVRPDGKAILKPIPLKTFSTTNSFGPGRAWVKRQFIDPAKYGDVVKYPAKVFNPQTQKHEEIIRTQVTLFGHWKENKYLDPKYIAKLQSTSDPNKRKSWYFGLWDIASGAALDDLWERSIHVKQRFKIPENWKLNRTLDWGSSKPFSVGWWAEANGEEVTLPSGEKWCPHPGSLIQVAEWYGTHELFTNEGVRMASKDVAQGIIEFEAAMVALKWFPGIPWSGPADNQIRQVNDRSTDTTAKVMEDKGIYWTESDKSPGSRKIGLQLMRDRLENAITGEGPGLYFFDNCRASIALLPILPRDEDDLDDVDSEAEDHAYDMVRYRVLAGASRVPDDLNVKWPT